MRDDRVRAALNLQLYTLTPTSGGSATQVEVEINVDPLGNFPVFSLICMEARGAVKLWLP